MVLAEAKDKFDATQKLLANNIKSGINKHLVKHGEKQINENAFQTITLE